MEGVFQVHGQLLVLSFRIANKEKQSPLHNLQGDHNWLSLVSAVTLNIFKDKDDWREVSSTTLLSPEESIGNHASWKDMKLSNPDEERMIYENHTHLMTPNRNSIIE
jgi:hypothetical protein